MNTNNTRHPMPTTHAKQAKPSRTSGALALIALALLAGCQGFGADEPRVERARPTAAVTEEPRASHGYSEDGDSPSTEGQGTPAPTGAVAADPADWCAGHGVPESKCTVCNPSLVEQFKASGDWCAEHGYPESVCPTCNPMAAPGTASAAAPGDAPNGIDWCTGHALPESMCTTCNPELIAQFERDGDWCAEHRFPESVCPTCNPAPWPDGVDRPSAIAAGTQVRFASPAIERAAGIEVVPATAAAMGVSIESTGHIEFNSNQMADVRSAVPGIVDAVSVDLGQHVEAGDALFSLESAHVGELQSRRQAARERVQADRANFERQESLRESAIASQRDVEVARQELQVAQAELRSIDQALRISGATRTGPTGRFTVHAPISGTVIRRPALVGSFADEPVALATIADTSVMWVLLDLPEWDAAAVRVGQHVDVRVDGLGGERFTGALSWVSSEVHPRTRTVEARAEVRNPDGVLRAGQFARARVQVEAGVGAVTVPTDAVQRVGDETFVFVRIAAGVYEPRAVQLGRTRERLVQVEGDVHAGDQIVTTGAFVLRTELSPDAIGAGCCEVEAEGGR